MYLYEEKYFVVGWVYAIGGVFRYLGVSLRGGSGSGWIVDLKEYI